MPLQSVAAQNTPGEIQLEAEYEPALKDLDGFSHLWVVSPPPKRAAYQTRGDAVPGRRRARALRHPNPIGLSVVRLLSIERATLLVDGLDLLDGLPVIDLKPYVPLFDSVE